jgi:hypothetical protein
MRLGVNFADPDASEEGHELPKAGEADHSVDDAGAGRVLTSEQVRDPVDLIPAEGYEPPVDAADDQKKKSDEIDPSHGESSERLRTVQTTFCG